MQRFYRWAMVMLLASSTVAQAGVATSRIHKHRKCYRRPRFPVLLRQHRSYLTVGPSMLYVDYKEFETDHSGVLDKENGTIPGIVMRLHHPLGAGMLSVGGGYYDGNLRYTGGYEGDAPLSSTFRAKHRIARYNIRLLYPLSQRATGVFSVFAELGHRRWDRATNAYRRVGDYRETYTHNEALLGVSLRYFASNRAWWDARIAYGGTFDAVLTSPDLSVTLPLGEKPIVEARLKVHYPITPRLTLYAGGHYRSFHYGRSVTSDANKFHSPILEPESRTQSLQMEVGLNYAL